MEDSDHILVVEMEKLLDEVAPTEADLAGSYVVDQSTYERTASEERKFGIPGAGLVTLVGPILLHFLVVIAMDICSATRKKGAELIADQLFRRLSAKLRSSLPKPKGKEETILAIVAALKTAGWDEPRAIKGANLAWESGLQTGRRFAQLSE